MGTGNLRFAGAGAKGNRFFAFDSGGEWDYDYDYEQDYEHEREWEIAI